MQSKTMTSGFTIIELMAVLAILAILVVVSLPMYSNYQARAYRRNAQALLAEVSQREEAYFSQNRAYTKQLNNLGITAAGVLDGLYTVGIAASSDATYTITLVAQGSQASRDSNCVTLTLDNTGNRGAADGSGTDSTPECWP